MADGVAEEGGAKVGSGGMRATIHVDDAPGMRAGDVEDENLFLFRNVDKFEAGSVKERRAGSGFAGDKRGILRIGCLAVIVNGFGPGLKGNGPGGTEATGAGEGFPVAFQPWAKAVYD